MFLSYSAVAACINLPIVVIHGHHFGFGAFFYVALAHWLLYMYFSLTPLPLSRIKRDICAGVPALSARVRGQSPPP